MNVYAKFNLHVSLKNEQIGYNAQGHQMWDRKLSVTVKNKLVAGSNWNEDHPLVVVYGCLKEQHFASVVEYIIEITAPLWLWAFW